MDERIRPKEFFISRFIYYSNLVDELDLVYVYIRDGVEIVDITDKRTKKRRRITSKNKNYEKYRDQALLRKTLRQRIKQMVTDYKEEWHGSLAEEASHYVIRPNTNLRFDTRLFNSFSNNQDGVTEYHKFEYKGIPMRSEFEKDIASVIDRLEISFKYEVKLVLNEYNGYYKLPDFALAFPEFNRCGFLEYLGALDDFKYTRKNNRKFEDYNNAGLYISRDIMYLPGDENYRPDEQTIAEMIMVMYSSIARMYLVRIK